MSGTCIILTSCGSEETAQEIVETLVDQKLAASATLLPNARTYYALENATRWEDVCQVLIYTTEEKFEAAARVIKRLDSFLVPEIFMVKLDGGSDEVLAWLRGMGRGKRPSNL